MPSSTILSYHQPENPGRVRKFEADCASCGARAACLAGGVPRADLEKAQSIVYVRRTLRRGETLFAAGDACSAVYAVRRGFFKTVLVNREGRGQVTGFFMAGDLLGMDGIGRSRHSDTAVSLEDGEVCVMPYSLVEPMARQVPALQRGLHAALSGEIAHNQRAMMVLGSMRADERMATFLLDLSGRLLRRGLSGSDLRLRMTRADIGSYLGLSLETVSRLFTLFLRKGLIRVHQKHVQLLDLGALGRILQRDVQPSPAVPLPARQRPAVGRRPARAGALLGPGAPA